MVSSRHTQFEEAIQSRMNGSVTASVLLVPVLLMSYVWLVNISILHPFSWIAGCSYTVFSLSFWVQALFLSVIVALISITSWKHFTVTMIVGTSRFWQFYSNLLNPERWLHSLCHGLAGGISAWLLTSLCGHRYQTISQPCPINSRIESNSKSTCMNEYHVFMVCYGFYTGVSYSINFFHQQQYHIVFPIVQQPRYFRVKNALLPTLMENIQSVIYQIRYYYLLYWLFGGYVRKWICTTLSIDTSLPGVDSIYGMLDITLLWTLLVTGLCIRLSWYSAGVFYKIFITMPYQFPIETVVEGKTCLVDALASSSRPLMTYQGFWHLYHVSQFSSDRRRDLFSLSQPGGHPHHWNGVVTECLRVLMELTELITRYSDCSPSVSAGQDDVTQKGGAGIDSGSLTSRHLTDNPETIVSPYGTKASNGNSSGVNIRKVKIITLYDKMLLDMKKKPAIAYFLSELPELRSQKLFATCQLQIWSLEALSLLICASVKEDEYGVVQKHIVPIITAILSLQEAVERHAKLGLNGRGRLVGGGCKPDLDTALRNNLKQSLKTSVYRITQSFGSHVCDLSLSYDHRRRLENCLDYKG